MPINIAPQEAVALLVTQAETVWTAHEQEQFLAELLTSNVWADRFNEMTDLKHTPSYDGGYQDGYAEKDETDRDAWRRTARAQEIHLTEAARKIANLETKIRALESEFQS